MKRFGGIGLWCLLGTLVFAIGCPQPVSVDEDGPATVAGEADAAAGKKRIIFLNNTNSPFWDTYRAGLDKGAEEFGLAEAGYVATMEVNDGTVTGQIDKLRQFNAQSDIAAVAISVLEPDNAAIVDELKKLQAKGIPVITVDGDLNRERFRDARSYYIGTENVAAGRALGKATKMILEEKGVTEGSYVMFVGRTGADNAQKRMAGFGEEMTGFKEADRMPDDGDRTKARENVRNAISNHADAVALVGIWSYNGPAIADVAVEKNVGDRVAVVTFDAEQIAIEKMAQGQIDLMVVQHPFDMGRHTARLLKAMAEGDESVEKELFPDPQSELGDIFNTDLQIVVPNAESAVMKNKDQFGEGVQVKTFDEFKAWLDEYDLKSS